MSLPSYLSNIKSSGMYRFVWDKSEVDNSSNEILRLVVGYSEKGPFNTPVYIKTQTEFIKIFGGISKKLEKRGVFFHRLALQSLAKGPILALNLKKFSYEDTAGNEFSRVEGVSFNPVKDANEGDAYDIKKLKVEDIYDTTRFWALDPSVVVDAQDEHGKIMNKYISVVSADSKETSNTIFMRGTSDKRYDVTVKEWYSAVASEEMPSYFEGFEDMMISDFLMKIYVFRGKFTKDVVSTSNLKKFFDITEDGEVILKPYIVNSFGEKIDTLEALADDESSNFINSYEGVTLPFFKDSKEQYMSLDLIFNGDYTSHKMMMNFNSAFLDNVVDNDGQPFTVDMISTTGAGSLEKVGDDIVVKNGLFNIASAIKPTISVGTWDETSTPKTFVFETVEGDSASTNFYKYVIGEGDTISGTELTSTNPQKWISSGIAVGDRVAGKSGVGRLVTVTAVDIAYDENNEPADITIKFSAELLDNEGIYLYTHTMGDITKNAKPCYLTGYTLMEDDMKPKSLNQWDKLVWQKNILSVLTNYEGIRIGLTNRKDSSWRYIVSTFEGLVEEECQSVISLIAKEKDNAFAFLNFPSAQTFKTCPYASFTDENGKYKVRYVVEGRNKKKPASVIFTLASEGNGASYCSYNTPLIFTDGTVKTAVPSAAMVCNNFMDKYTTRHPFDAVAGEKYGYMNASGLVGPDLNYSREDLDLLEPFGVNVMVFEPKHGTYINSNQTAKQKPETALSKIHVRELTIWLQDEIEDMMRNYHWDKNTASLRDTIKSQAEKICDLCKTNGGITKSYCQCNDENNTPEVIDKEMLVLSVHVEPARCAGKMVQELTLYKTGGLSSVVNE